MKILAQSLKIVSFAGLANVKHVQIGGKGIPQILVRVVIFGTLVLCIILQVFVCIHRYASGLTDALLPLGISMTFTAMTLTHLTLAWKADKIAQLMAFLQHVVQQSKITSNGRKFRKFLSHMKSSRNRSIR